MTTVHPLVAGLLALLVVGFLGLLLRWAFGRGRSLAPRPPHRGNPDEYGLLVSVAAPADRDEAGRLAALLAAEGIRNTLVPTTVGPRLMVWPDDAARARQVLDRN